jgi:hypothetical protein
LEHPGIKKENVVQVTEKIVFKEFTTCGDADNNFLEIVSSLPVVSVREQSP